MSMRDELEKLAADLEDASGQCCLSANENVAALCETMGNVANVLHKITLPEPDGELRKRAIRIIDEETSDISRPVSADQIVDRILSLISTQPTPSEPGLREAIIRAHNLATGEEQVDDGEDAEDALKYIADLLAPFALTRPQPAEEKPHGDPLCRECEDIHGKQDFMGPCICDRVEKKKNPAPRLWRCASCNAAFENTNGLTRELDFHHWVKSKGGFWCGPVVREQEEER